jgi:hypothetical protein
MRGGCEPSRSALTGSSEEDDFRMAMGFYVKWMEPGDLNIYQRPDQLPY